MKIARQLYSGDVVVLQPVDAGHGCFYTVWDPNTANGSFVLLLWWLGHDLFACTTMHAGGVP